MLFFFFCSAFALNMHKEFHMSKERYWSAFITTLSIEQRIHGWCLAYYTRSSVPWCMQSSCTFFSEKKNIVRAPHDFIGSLLSTQIFPHKTWTWHSLEFVSPSQSLHKPPAFIWYVNFKCQGGRTLAKNIAKKRLIRSFLVCTQLRLHRQNMS